MKQELEILFLMVLVMCGVVYSSRSCVPPPGPPGAPNVPPPVCRGPCKCDATNCPGGLVTGVCNCNCQVCAKQEGECCGGWRNYQGICDVGLRCRIIIGPAEPPAPPGGPLLPGIPGGILGPGVCVRIN